MKGIMNGVLALLLVSSALVVAEDEQRDYYAEPGLNPFKSSTGQDVTEHIDPFSGNIQLRYVDLTIPGNGGLDINITRVYNVPQSPPAYGNPFGYGWTMHFGRITVPSGHAAGLCSGPYLPSNNLDNPSLEMPDGGRELLVRSSALGGGTFITKSNWKAECVDTGDYTKGLIATAPNGTKYYMREYVYMQGEAGSQGEPAPWVETWLTDRIEDLHGNTIDLSYLEIANNQKLATSITSSDGRTVSLNYQTTSGSNVTASSSTARLHSISANGQTWTYEHTQIGNVSTGWGSVHHYTLDRVVRPDGTSWNFDYEDTPGDPGFDRLSRVTYPMGGSVDYTYQWVWPAIFLDPDFKILAIDSKVQTNPGQAAGTWTYEFFPGAVALSDTNHPEDYTQITTPDGREIYFHYGYRSVNGRTDAIWQMGLALRHDILEWNSSLQQYTQVRVTTYDWEKRPISDEVYLGGLFDAQFDSKTFAPVMQQERVLVADAARSGSFYPYTNDYANWDAYGNPTSITERVTGGFGSNTDRVKSRTHINDTVNWLIGLPASETIAEGGQTANTSSWTYYSHGKLESETHNGVTTSYTYWPAGDLKDVVSARSHTTTFSQYHRGVPRLEEYPDLSTVSRTINNTGTVATEVSGRGHTTAFGYDALNRLTSIDYPIGDDVSVDWYMDRKVLSRGDFRETVRWDGYGQEIQTVREDTARGTAFTQNTDYDELGRRTFVSDINAATGIAWEYDVLGRVTKTTFQDGSFQSVSYDGETYHDRTDENGITTRHQYVVYGSLADQYQVYVFSPEGVLTSLVRDGMGRDVQVSQGGLGLDPDFPNEVRVWDQLYGYNANKYLVTVNHTGFGYTVTYGRDQLGNMTSKTVGTSNPVYYTYDTMNRLSNTDFQEDAIDVVRAYDADGNLASVANGFSTRIYGYDQNNNLTTESVDIGANNYTVQYVINGLDHLSSIDYPSGRDISYNPDALGRPTQAMPYLSNVNYFADGSLQQLTYGNGKTTTYTRTARKWIDLLNVSGVVALDYDYDAAGNITALADGINPANSKSMVYDDLNRLVTTSGSWGTSQYEYDAVNNLKRKTDVAQSNREQYYQYNGMYMSEVQYGGTSLRRTSAYDARGNLEYSDDATWDLINDIPVEVFTRRYYQFDDADNLRYVSRSFENEFGQLVPIKTGSFSSFYDGKNQRVRREKPGEQSIEYLYSDAGRLLGEYDSTGVAYGNEYFYLGAQKIATAKTNAPPVVDLGGEQTVYGGASVSLVASQNDLDGDIVSAMWTQISGPAVTIADPTSSSTSFTAPETTAGVVVVVEYTATDDKGGMTTQQLTINVSGNQAPIADAGPDQTASAGDLVQLNGSESSDPDGSISSYQWTQSAGSMVALTDGDTATPSFSAPYVMSNETLTFELVVTDSQGAQSTDTVNVVLLGDTTAPQTTAAQVHYKEQGKWVYELTLTTDEPVAEMYWRINDLATIVTSCGLDNTTAWQSYTCGPIVVNTQNLDPVFQWYAVDLAGNSEAPKAMILDGSDPGTNLAPFAAAGADQVIVEGSTVNLNGTGSYDNDGVITTYTWQQVSGPATSLPGGNTAIASFLAPDVSGDMMLTFELTVMDDQGATGTDITMVLIQDTGMDVSPPVTGYASHIVKIKGANQHTITLTANEPSTTFYRTDPSDPWVVLPPGNNVVIQLAKKQELTFYYYSVDTAGNTETINTELLQ